VAECVRNITVQLKGLQYAGPPYCRAEMYAATSHAVPLSVKVSMWMGQSYRWTRTDAMLSD